MATTAATTNLQTYTCVCSGELSAGLQAAAQTVTDTRSAVIEGGALASRAVSTWLVPAVRQRVPAARGDMLAAECWFLMCEAGKITQRLHLPGLEVGVYCVACLTVRSGGVGCERLAASCCAAVRSCCQR